MKRFLSLALLLMLLVGAAIAEPAASQTPVTLPVISPTPTAAPTPEPAGTLFSNDQISLYLPEDMEALTEEELAGFTAAALDDFPDAAQMILAASHIDRDAYVLISQLEAAQSPAEAAREAANTILGSDAGVLETAFGGNTCACFACAIGETTFNLYYFSNGEALICITCCGLEDAQIHAMLNGMKLLPAL